MQSGVSETRRAMGSVASKAGTDPEYKSKLLKNPRATLAADGVDLPDDVSLTVTVDAEDNRNIILSDEPLPWAKDVDSLPKQPNLDWGTVHAYVHEKCRKDAAFRAEFIKNPAATVRRLGYALPEGTTISVHTATDKQKFLNLPLARKEGNGPGDPISIV
jgi:hypothetical protein